MGSRRHYCVRPRKPDPGPLTASFGRVVVVLRRIKELSVNALASRADMTPERIRTLQAGADNPTLREIRQLAVAFETTEADLVTLVIEEARQP